MTRFFYKAVQPSGFDFYSGTVDYASLSLAGKKLPRLPGGVYHASDTPSETLIGGGWPCRLFMVAGKPVSQEGHKFGFRTLQVVGELEAWQALGPCGKEVAAFIEGCPAALGTPPWNPARDAAWAAAWAAARAAARAAAGLIVRDLITPEQLATLQKPWRILAGETAV